ncbi:MAG: hypothetical protein MI919_19415, partial [Holophagales bacterium]|nr:hypothetical protein [Holophagales bacterium]
SFWTDDANVLWVGTNGGGLNRFDRSSGVFRRYRHDPDNPASLGRGQVRAILGASDGGLWVGMSASGLNRFDPATETFIRYRHDPEDPNSLSDDAVWALHKDNEGALWAHRQARERYRLMGD